jgi:hypothetical protein
MKLTASIPAIAAVFVLSVGCNRQERSPQGQAGVSELEEREAELFKLSDEELFEIGVTATDAGWAVAWSTESEEDIAAIDEALDSVSVSANGSCGRGRCGWYVRRSDFFVAQQALLKSDRVRSLGIKVVVPKDPTETAVSRSRGLAEPPPLDPEAD